MSVQCCKGSDAVQRTLITQYNALRGTVAVAGSKYHKDVTSLGTTGSFESLTASALQVTAATATGTATDILMANNIKAVFNTHIADTTAHKVVDAADIIATADATDAGTFQTLATAIQTKVLAHIASVTYHYTADASTEATVISSQATARTSVNAIKTLLNAHINSAPAGLSINLVDA